MYVNKYCLYAQPEENKTNNALTQSGFLQ